MAGFGECFQFPRAAVVMLVFACFAAAPASGTSSATRKSDIKPVSKYFSSLEKDRAFSGVVLIASEGRILLNRGYGLADFELGVKMTPRNVFRIGSLTKPVTASSVLATIEMGKMKLESKACEFLAMCPTAWKEVTIEHLLTHTSGIKDHFGDLEAAPVEATVKELDRVLKTLPADEPLVSAPGETYSYSNFNYVLLGAILEAVHGETWESVLRKSIFDRLGLESLSYDDVFEIVRERARGYDFDDEKRLKNIKYDDHAAYAAGGLRSTVSDFYAWSQAAIDGKIFSGVLLERAFTPYRGNYGYGWQIREFFGRRMYNHSGGIDGFSTHIAHYVDADLTIVVFSNIESDEALLHACDAANLIFGWSDPPTKISDWNDMEPRDRCGLTEPTKGKAHGG